MTEETNTKKWSNNQFYELYKKLPTIITVVVTLVIFFIWSIVDVCVFQDRWGDTVFHYGILRTKTWIGSIMIWWLIGIALSFFARLMTAITISPVIASADALIFLENQKRKEVTRSSENQ